MKLVLLLVIAGGALAQTRGIVPEEVVKARPQPKVGVAAKAPQYRPIDSQVTSSLRQPSSARQVGITIWRLRPAQASDSGARILVQEESAAAEWVPERVAASSGLKQGDRVRLTIESPDSGFLYVIDRERYSSGERGQPYLIFPTTHTHGGDNKAVGGRLVDLPGQDDHPNFFTLRQSRPDQTEEELTVLLTNEPLQGIEIGPKALPLTQERVEHWEKQWGTVKTELFELSGGVGKTWTQTEQQAAATSTRLLTQDDPPPQTVYRVSVKPDEPLMVKVRLRYSSPSQTSNHTLR
jgi:hypothetical protein